MEDLFEDVIETTVEAEEDKGQDVAEKTTQESEGVDKKEKWRDSFFKEKQKSDELSKKVKKYEEAFETLGIDKDPEKAVLKHKAEKTGQTEDEIREEIKRYKAQGKEEAEAEMRERERMTALRLKDLEDIKAEHPECKVSDTLELGQEFVELMSLGRYTAVEAYEIATRKKPEKKATVSTGSTESYGSANEKTFFTADEVRNMSPDDQEKFHDVIMKSMTKW